MSNKWMQTLQSGESLWIDELRRAEGSIDMFFRLTLPDGRLRDFACSLFDFEDEGCRALNLSYLSATVFNLLSAYGGRRLRIFAPWQDERLTGFAGRLEEIFLLREKKRDGYGKCINVADRISAAFGEGAFSLELCPIEEYSPISETPETAAADLGQVLQSSADKADRLCCCGIDVGGTDIKLALSLEGRLISVKEFDWNPAASPVAEGYTEPIILLARLMRARAAAEGSPLAPELEALMPKDTELSLIEKAVSDAEAKLGEGINVLDVIGLSFPDVVIENRIVGGETPKTKSMRENPAIDYEAEFKKIGLIKERLEALCREDGRVHLTNDGNMAAFTAAMELAMEHPEEIEKGVIAHSLGTDFGSGWLAADGRIPGLSLEMYDFLLDLGSLTKQSYELEDLRSVRNENSGLPGARRYLGQAGVFRMAWEREPALLEGFTAARGDTLLVPTEPADLRKPCLEHLMNLAAEGNEDACEVFRTVGENLAHMSLEIDYALRPENNVRWLFGRFVKNPRCFELIQEGCRRLMPQLELRAADDDMAVTPLMRQLAAWEGVTVAQFAQAIGAIYYGVQQSEM